MWLMGLVALWHVESSLTRDQTHIPCIGRQILNYWTTREVLNNFLKIRQLALILKILNRSSNNTKIQVNAPFSPHILII